ncbi:MAG: hypothetical protein IKP20_02750 [Candidatus Methanomethylophilaceae archaeon]|jgi:hypothetical protein|nr:hypothetical protein [Candidatus Methanomethylophilaceae archaeon]
MSNWDIWLDYFKEGLIPYSEYLWMALIVGICGYALYKSRKIVSEL